MTGIRPTVQHTWDQTVLWLDHLYGDSANPGDVTESTGAESVSGDEPVLAVRADSDVVDSVAGSAEPMGVEDAASDSSETLALFDMTTAAAAPAELNVAGPGEDTIDQPPPTPTQPVDDAAAEEHGSWWLQEPPTDHFEYFDLDPVDLDEPLGPAQPRGAAGTGRTSARRNGHPASSDAPRDEHVDSEHGFAAAEDAWLPEAAGTSPTPTAPLTAPTAPAALLAGDDPGRTAPRFNKALAMGFVAATVVGTIAVTSILLGMRPDPTPDAAMDPDGSTQISVVAAPAPSAAVDPTGGDAPIPFVASADCPAGSTPAQSVAGGDPTRAWVCVRGGVDGQVLTLDLGRTMLVTALSITPGWVGADATGNDQWLAHRVLTRIQWVFDGDPSTVITQTTGNIRGEAVQPVPGRGVLASKITMIVLQTSRPPADVPPTSTPGASGGFFDPALPSPGPAAPAAAPTEIFALPGLPASAASTDPVDTTCAVSAIKVLGHPPA